MSIIATVLAYGLLFIVAIILVSILLTVVCYYLSSRILGSPNASWRSAFRLLGWSILIGFGVGIVGTIVSGILPSGTLSYIGSILVFIGYIVLLVRTTNKIYALGKLKSALLLLMSVVMYGVISAAFFLALYLILPKSTVDTATSDTTISDSLNSDTGTTAETVEKCQMSSDCADNGNCITGGICVSDEVLNKDYPQGDCETMACTNCFSTHMVRAYTVMKMGGANIDYCMECNPLGVDDELCVAGYECYLGKCIKSDPNNPKGMINCATLPCEGCAKDVKSGVLRSDGTSNEWVHACRECRDNEDCKAGYECKDEVCTSTTARPMPKLPKLPSAN